MQRSDAIEVYNACCEYFDYIQIMSEDKDITIDKANDIFDMLGEPAMIVMYCEISRIVDAISFYRELLIKISNVKTQSDLIELIKYIYVENKTNEALHSQYDIVIFCMKICTHLIWGTCTCMYTNSSSTEVIDSKKIINDIIENNFTRNLE